MNVLATAEAWVAANQVIVMAVFIATFVAVHLVLLAKAVKEEAEATEQNSANQEEEDFWAAVYATPWMM
ncbi:MAG: hypothetical protein AAF614_33425 [Chloroflexota bacterium]